MCFTFSIFHFLLFCCSFCAPEPLVFCYVSFILLFALEMYDKSKRSVNQPSYIPVHFYLQFLFVVPFSMGTLSWVYEVKRSWLTWEAVFT